MEKLKPINNPRDMFLETVTPEAMEYVNYLKKEYKERLEKYMYLNNTWSMLRYLRARDFDIKKTKKMLEDSLNY